MKVCVVTSALLCLAGGASATALEARLSALERKNAALEAQVETLRRAQDDAGELRVFKTDACPSGWVEAEATKGFLLVSRPAAASAGTVINTPLTNKMIFSCSKLRTFSTLRVFHLLVVEFQLLMPKERR